MSNRIVRGRVSACAMHAETQRLAQGDVVAPKVTHGCIDRHRKRRWSSRQGSGGRDASSPAAIAPVNKIGELAQLALDEVDLEIEGRVAQAGCALKAAFHLECAGVAYGDVGAHGVCVEPDTPFIFGLKPKGKVGVGKCECFFHLAEFEVDASSLGFHVREARS